MSNKNIAANISINVEGANESTKEVGKLREVMEGLAKSQTTVNERISQLMGKQEQLQAKTKETQGVFGKLSSEFGVFGVSIDDIKGKLSSALGSFKSFNKSVISLESSLKNAGKKGINGITKGLAFFNISLKTTDKQVKSNTKNTKAYNFVLFLTEVASKAAALGFRLLTIALIGTGIGAIVVAFGSFVALLLKSRRFTDALSKKLSQLGAVAASVGNDLANFNFSGIGSRAAEAARAVGELSDAMVRLRQQRGDADILSAKNELLIKEQLKTAEDTTETIVDRIAAYEEIKKLRLESVTAQKAANALEIDALERIKRNTGDKDFAATEDYERLNELIKEQYALEGELTDIRRDSKNQINTLRDEQTKKIEDDAAKEAKAKEDREKKYLKQREDNEKKIQALKDDIKKRQGFDELVALTNLYEADLKAFKGTEDEKDTYKRLLKEKFDLDSKKILEERANAQRDLDETLSDKRRETIIDEWSFPFADRGQKLQQLDKEINEAEDELRSLEANFKNLKDQANAAKISIKAEDLKLFEDEIEDLELIIEMMKQGFSGTASSPYDNTPNREYSSIVGSRNTIKREEKRHQLALIDNQLSSNLVKVAEEKRHNDEMIKLRMTLIESLEQLTNTSLGGLRVTSKEIKNLEQENKLAKAKGNNIDTKIKIAGIDDTKERLNKVASQSLEVTNHFQDALNLMFQKNIDYYDRMINKQQKSVERARRDADKGGVEALQLEEDRLDELQLKREDVLDKQAKANRAFKQGEIIANTALTISNIKLGAAKSFAQSGVAAPIVVPITIAAIAGLIATAANFYTPPSFYEGTENFNPTNQKVNDGLGGSLAILHPNERVVPASVNKHLNGIKNADLPRLISNNSGLIAAVNETNKRLDNLEIYFNVDQRGFSAGMSQFTKRQVRRNKLIR